MILLSVVPGSGSAFPGANGKIAFDTDRGSVGDNEIFVMNADGSAQTNLTNNPARDDAPAWPAGGTKIAFETDRGSGGNDEIFVMNADGSGQTNLTNDPAADQLPAWSPDATKIAFQTNRDGNSEVYVMNADGSGQTNLTNIGATDERPDWQPLALPGSPPGSEPLLPADSTRPHLSRLSLTNKLFRAAGPRTAGKRAPRGTSFRYTLSEAALVTFTIQRKLAGRRVGGKCRKPTRGNRSRRKCARYPTAGRLTQDAVAGPNTKPFSGRLKGRKLKPGLYRAQLTARDPAGNRSSPVTVSFRIARVTSTR